MSPFAGIRFCRWTIAFMRFSQRSRICRVRRGISRLPEVAAAKPAKKRFQAYPIGYLHIDIAEVQTAEGKLYLYVAIDRASKFTVVPLVEPTGRTSGSAFLERVIEAFPYKIHTVLTDNGIQFTFPPRYADCPLHHAHVRHPLPRERHRAPADKGEASLDQRAGRTDEPNNLRMPPSNASTTTVTNSSPLTCRCSSTHTTTGGA